MLRKSNPEMSPNPRNVPMNPPTIAPTIPRTMVRIIPPGALPGMRNLAIAPAIRPNKTHISMPIVNLPFAVPPAFTCQTLVRFLVSLRYESSPFHWLFIVVFVLVPPFWELHLLPGRVLVGNQTEQMGDAVQPRAPF